MSCRAQNAAPASNGPSRLDKVLRAGMDTHVITRAQKIKNEREQAELLRKMAPDSFDPFGPAPMEIDPPPIEQHDEREPLVAGLRQLPLLAPVAESNPVFHNELFGDVGKLVQLMMQGAIVSSYTNKVVLGGNIRANTTEWQKFGNEVSKRNPLGKGTSNTSFKVTTEMFPGPFRASFPGVKLPPMVFRRTNKTATYNDLQTAKRAVEELIITGYAALNMLGPKLYGAFIINMDRPNMLGLSNKVKTYMFTEAWSGDLHDPLALMWIPPDRFAQQLSLLLHKSQIAGLWQMDAKPPNMLYRGSRQDTEICWTDFDSYWCTIWPPDLRTNERCSVLVHASLIMGYISCTLGNDVFRFYQPAVRAQLQRDFELDLTSDIEVCAWLDDLEQERAPANQPHASMTPAEHGAKLRVASRLRATMQQYLMSDKDAGTRCILKPQLPEPSFVQFLNFALASEGNSSVESWAGLRTMPGIEQEQERERLSREATDKAAAKAAKAKAKAEQDDKRFEERANLWRERMLRETAAKEAEAAKAAEAKEVANRIAREESARRWPSSKVAWPDSKIDEAWAIVTKSLPSESLELVKAKTVSQAKLSRALTKNVPLRLALGFTTDTLQGRQNEAHLGILVSAMKTMLDGVPADVKVISYLQFRQFFKASPVALSHNTNLQEPLSQLQPASTRARLHEMAMMHVTGIVEEMRAFARGERV